MRVILGIWRKEVELLTWDLVVWGFFLRRAFFVDLGDFSLLCRANFAFLYIGFLGVSTFFDGIWSQRCRKIRTGSRRVLYHRIFTLFDRKFLAKSINSLYLPIFAFYHIRFSHFLPFKLEHNLNFGFIIKFVFKFFPLDFWLLKALLRFSSFGISGIKFIFLYDEAVLSFTVKQLENYGIWGIIPEWKLTIGEEP